MANSAHFVTSAADRTPLITVRDDRGATVTELEVPTEVSELVQVDNRLRSIGWTRNAEWTTTDEGWTAPVVPS